MSTLRITIKMDNAAFDDSGEASRILRHAADCFDNSGVYVGQSFTLCDYNGIVVGKVKVTL